MKRHSCALIFSGLLLLPLFSQENPTGTKPEQNQFSPDVEKQIQKILAAQYPYDTDTPGFVSSYVKLFKSIGPEGLRKLQTYPHESIAIQAAWEEVALTVPEKDSGQVVRPDRPKLDWFLGFVEGRASAKAPAWWAKSLVDARANRRDNIYFSSGDPKDRPYHKAGLDWVLAPNDTTLKKDGDKALLTIGKESIQIPPKMLHKFDQGEFYGAVSGLMTPSRCYLAVHTDTGGGYPLVCIDRATGNTIWKNRVMEMWWGGGSGQSHQWVAITEQNKRIVVFGCWSLELQIEAFGREDGKSLFRFATTY
jgi:hypothetical protein